MFSTSGSSLHKRFPFLARFNVVNVLLTFLLVSFAWIFFRASGFATAWHMTTHLLSPAPDGNFFSLLSDSPRKLNLYLGFPRWKLLSSVGLVSFLMLCDWGIEKGYLLKFNSQPIFVRWSVYYLLILVILLFGVFETNSFIYFQF